MPTTVDVDYLDGEFTVSEQEPSTIAELTEMIGEQAIVDETTSNLRYRNKYPRIYKLVSSAVEAAGFARPDKIGKDGQPVTKTVKGKDGAPDTTAAVKADPTAHLRAYLATGEEAKAKLAELFNSIAPAEPLFKSGERAGGGGKIAQWAQNAANEKFAAGEDAVANAVLVIEETVPGYKVGVDADGAATPDSLARGIAALKKHFDDEAKKKAKSLLG